MPNQQKNVFGPIAREIEDQSLSNLSAGFEPSTFAIQAAESLAETAYQIDRATDAGVEIGTYPKYVVASGEKAAEPFRDMASAMLEATKRIDEFDIGVSVYRHDAPPVLSTENNGRIFEATGVKLFRHGDGFTQDGEKESRAAANALANEYLEKAEASELPVGAEMYLSQLQPLREKIEAGTGDSYDIAVRGAAMEKIRNIAYHDAHNHTLWSQVRVPGHLDPIAGSVENQGWDYIDQVPNLEKLQRIGGFIPNGNDDTALLSLEDVEFAYKEGFEGGIVNAKNEARERLSQVKSTSDGLVPAKDVLPAIMADMRYAITEGISQIKTDNPEIAAALIANFNGQTAMYNTIAERLEKETGREYMRLETKPQLQQILMQVEQQQEAKLALNYAQQHSRGRSLQA